MYVVVAVAASMLTCVWTYSDAPTRKARRPSGELLIRRCFYATPVLVIACLVVWPESQCWRYAAWIACLHHAMTASRVQAAARADRVALDAVDITKKKLAEMRLRAHVEKKELSKRNREIRLEVRRLKRMRRIEAKRRKEEFRKAVVRRSQRRKTTQQRTAKVADHKEAEGPPRCAPTREPVACAAPVTDEVTEATPAGASMYDLFFTRGGALAPGAISQSQAAHADQRMPKPRKRAGIAADGEHTHFAMEAVTQGLQPTSAGSGAEGISRALSLTSLLRSVSRRFSSRRVASEQSKALARSAKLAAAASESALVAAFGAKDQRVESFRYDAPQNVETDFMAGLSEYVTQVTVTGDGSDSDQGASGSRTSLALSPRQAATKRNAADGQPSVLRRVVDWWRRKRSRTRPTAARISRDSWDDGKDYTREQLLDRKYGGHYQQMALPSGDLVFVHSRTGKAQMEPPEWIDIVDPATGKLMFLNTVSGQQVAGDVPPKKFVPIMWENRAATVRALTVAKRRRKVDARKARLRARRAAGDPNWRHDMSKR